MSRTVFLTALVGLVAALGLGDSRLPTAAATPTADSAASPTTCPATTEAENLAIARIWHEQVINQRNPTVLDEILAPELVHHAAGGYPEEMDPAGVGAMMNGFLAAFPNLRYTFDFFVVEDDMVVQRYTATGTQEGALGDLPATGRTATWTGINIFEIDCGRIAGVITELDAIGRLDQLGLLP